LFDSKTADPVKSGLFGKTETTPTEPEKKQEEKKPALGGMFSLKPDTDAPKPSLFSGATASQQPEKVVEKKVEMNLNSDKPPPSLSTNPFLAGSKTTSTNPFLTTKLNTINETENTSSLKIPTGNPGFAFPKAENKSEAGGFGQAQQQQPEKKSDEKLAGGLFGAKPATTNPFAQNASQPSAPGPFSQSSSGS